MTPRLLLAGLLAAATPAVALWFAAPADRASAGLAVAPFGWPSLVAVHVAAALPLAAGLGAFARRRLAPATGAVPPPGPVVVGALLALLAGTQAEGLGELLDGVGFAGRVAARTLLCVLLAAPWFLLAPTDGLGRLAPALLGTVLAVALPAIHADALARQGMKDGEELRRRDRFVRARPHWVGVCDLAPDRVVPNLRQRPTPPEVLRFIESDIAKITKGVSAGIPAGASGTYRLLFAEALLKLDRAAEAEAVLRSLPVQPEVTLRLSEALENQGRHDENESLLRQALDGGQPAFRREVYDRLARSASGRYRGGEVEHLLREAAGSVPEFAGYFRLQLGRHLQRVGRPLDALAAFDQAVALDPNLGAEAETHRREIREQTPVCLIGR